MAWFHRFMRGRYGPDQLAVALLALGFLLTLCGRLFSFFPLLLLGYGCFGWAAFRFLSVRIAKRSRENQIFLAYTSRWTEKLRRFVSSFTSKRKAAVFPCPYCGQKVRVPRGKGKIIVHCPKCKNSFYEKS